MPSSHLPGVAAKKCRHSGSNVSSSSERSSHSKMDVPALSSDGLSPSTSVLKASMAVAYSHESMNRAK